MGATAGRGSLGLTMGATAAPPARSAVRKALVKKTGALTVGIEYTGADGANLRTLSAYLRENDIAAIYATDVGAIASFVDEQATAKGDFPGPVPVSSRAARRTPAPPSPPAPPPSCSTPAPTRSTAPR